MDIVDHVLMINLARDLAVAKDKPDLSSFISGTLPGLTVNAATNVQAVWTDRLKLGEELADTCDDANVALRRWDEILFDIATAVASGGIDAALRGVAKQLIAYWAEGTFLKQPNAFHHFAEPGYSLAEDEAQSSFSKAWIYLIKDYFNDRWADDCDSVLDPLSLDQNWGDEERYELCYDGSPPLVHTSFKGYRWRSASYYGKYLWLRYWHHMCNSQFALAAVALGKLAHLAQDLAAVPHHSAHTIGDNHSDFETDLSTYLAGNRAAVLNVAKTQFANTTGLPWNKPFNILDKDGAFAFLNSIAKYTTRAAYPGAFSDNRATREDEAKKTAPLALLATYRVLESGLDAYNSFINGGNILDGVLYSAVAPQGGLFSEGNDRTVRQDIMLPAPYFVDQYWLEDPDNERNVKECQTGVFNDGASQGLRLEYTVHGNGGYGGRGWKVTLATVRGRKGTLRCSFTKCNHLSAALLAKRGEPTYRRDSYDLQISWVSDFAPTQPTSYVVKVDGRPRRNGAGAASSDPSGGPAIPLDLLTRGPDKAQYSKRIELEVGHGGLSASAFLNVLIPRPYVAATARVVNARPATRPAIWPLVAQALQTDAWLSLDDLKLQKIATEGEINELWPRRVFVLAPGVQPAPTSGLSAPRITYKYHLGYIRKPIEVDFQPRWFVGRCSLSGRRSIYIRSSRQPHDTAPINPLPDPYMVTTGFNQANFSDDLRINIEVDATDEAQQKPDPSKSSFDFFAKLLVCVAEVSWVPLASSVLDPVVQPIREDVRRLLDTAPRLSRNWPAARVGTAITKAIGPAWDNTQPFVWDYILRPFVWGDNTTARKATRNLKSRSEETLASAVTVEFQRFLAAGLRQLGLPLP